MQDLAKSITDSIFQLIKNNELIEVEASGRHVHLCRADIDILFGKGHQLTKVKDLSQPGQYACAERVTLTGPKGNLKNVVVLGPERKESQAEISLTDGLALGIKGPIRESGQIANTPGITVATDREQIILTHGLITARRHLHITPEDAKRLNVSNKEIIKIKVYGQRPLIFDDVVVRVHQNFATRMHIDYDEANACGFVFGTLGVIQK